MPSVSLIFGDLNYNKFTISNTSSGKTIAVPGITSSVAFGQLNASAFTVSVHPAISVSLSSGQKNQAAFTLGILSVVAAPLATGQTNAAAFSITVGNHIPAPLSVGQTSETDFTIHAGNSIPSPLVAGQTSGTFFIVRVGNVGPLSAACALSVASVGTLYAQFIPVTGGVSPYAYALTEGTIPTNLNVVALGDSLTVGYPVNPAGAYPTQLGALLGTTVLNLGINGEQSAGVLATEVPLAIAAYAGGKNNVALLWIGRNDVAAGSGMLPGLQANDKAIVSALHAPGFKVIALTLTPSNFAGQPPNVGTDIASQNTWLLSGGSGADAICDSGDDPRLASTLNTIVYQADQVHMTSVGYGIVASDVAVTITGSLPPGLTLNTSTGLISGIPAAPGSFSYQVTVTDSIGSFVVINCRITVSGGGGNPCALLAPSPSTDVQFQLQRVIASMKPASRVPVRGG